MKDAPILILDEPTSAIDSKTEAVILDALDRLMQGRTTFMIAHRFATIRNADLILVLHHGEVVGRGTHEELLARGGLYKQLSDLQTAQARRRTRRASASSAPRMCSCIISAKRPLATSRRAAITPGCSRRTGGALRRNGA